MKQSIDSKRLPVTLDDWHRALGFHKCATCGTPIGNGIPFVWQGRNRWYEECFWGDDSQNAISDVSTDFDAPEKQNTDAGSLSAARKNSAWKLCTIMKTVRAKSRPILPPGFTGWRYKAGRRRKRARRLHPT